MTYPIDISGVTKRYGDIVALDNVDIMVEKGELFGLIGPDGAGKSSLYMILATLLAPDTGTATVCGLDTVKDFRQLRTRIGYMPEKFSLYQDLTVAENLKFLLIFSAFRSKRTMILLLPYSDSLRSFLLVWPELFREV